MENPVPMPVDHGRSARLYLETEGMVARIPAIRSSDYSSALSDPFGYYLRRRLGLVPALMYSEALSRGSYFHTLFALYDRDDRWKIFGGQCAARLEELNALCKNLSFTETTRAEAVQNEQLDQATAAAWFTAFESLACIDGHSASEELCHYEKLGAELRLTWVDEEMPKTRQVAQFDLLLLNRKTNALWIVDAKTTASPPLIRLATVKHEFQTQHYLHALEWFLDRGLLHNRYPSLPKDVRIGGMMHVAVLKPSISFGQSDRDFRWESEGKRTGVAGRIIRTPVNLKDQGTHVIQWTANQPYAEPFCGTLDECVAELHERTGKKPEKAYTGEPTLHNFSNRCLRWYKGEGEYADRAPDFANDPPINISYTHASVLLDKDWRKDYLSRVAMIYNLATLEANPCNFLKNIDSIRMGARLAQYSPFYLTEPKEWPAMVHSRQFLLAHRDAGDLPPVPEPHEFDGLVESLEPVPQC
jgi:hypothetical protein